ncbi:MAG: pseudouridine synthase [Blautia sp.]|nr:pseudouridine synthase [Blautia sp.]
MGKIRLDKYLADMGLGTRTEVKKDIKKGRISVNQEIIKSPEYKIDIQTDVVLADGKEIAYEKMVYYMLNKPQGVVSATEDRRDRTVLELIQEKKRKDLFPVGRLDKDTEGLLLITNDGELAHNLLAPKKHVDKKYFVRLKNALSEENRKHLEEGVDIGEDRLTMPSQVFLLNEEKNEVEIIIREGKFHQIKRMFHAVGNEVVFLKRLSMGSLVLDENLLPGEYRLLTPEEIVRLKENA